MSINLSILFIFLFSFSEAQTSSFFKENYVSHHALNLSTSFNIIANIDTREVLDFNHVGGASISSLYGFIFLKYFSFQVGLSLEYFTKINTFNVPVNLNFKWYLMKYAENSPYLLIGFGPSIYSTNFKNESNLVKGIGYSFEYNSKSEIFVELT